MTTDRTDPALLSERHGVPIWLIERSAAARAKASQLTLEAVLAEWVSREGATVDSPEQADRQQPTADSPEVAASDQPPATSQHGGGGPTLSGAALLTAVAEARGMPESIIERSANARAGAAGVSLEDVLHEWAQEEGLEAPGDQPPPASPKPTTSSPLPTPKPKAKPAVSVESGLTGAASLTAVAEARGMPESLVERSAKARAKKTDSTLEDVLNEWAEEAGLTTASPSEPTPSPTPSVAAGQALTGAALLTAVAEARGMPESLVERSAKARAKKTDSTLEDVLNEWAEEAGLTTASPSEPTPSPTPSVAAGRALTGAALLTAVAEARGMPESLVERSAKARAKKTDSTLEDVLNEWAEEAGLTTASPSEPTPSPAPSVAAGQALTGAALLTAVAEARGMPESLVERSAKARAKKTDSTLEDVLNEWAEEAGLTTASDQPPAAVPTEAVTLEDGQDDSQTSDGGVQEADAAAEPISRQARSWRHAMAVGAITALVPLVILVTFAVFVDVPASLSDAPWYLLGLEPFLGYLEPFIALVIVPGVALASLLILAVVAWNPAVHPSTRRLALMTLVILILAIGTLTIVGALQA